jgi:hypothetical protein
MGGSQISKITSECNPKGRRKEHNGDATADDDGLTERDDIASNLYFGSAEG